MSLYAYLHQSGGCDYTIGCGNLLISLSSPTLNEALIELKNTIRDGYTGDRELSSVQLIEGESIKIDVKSIYDEIAKEQMLLKNKRQEEEERILYNMLKKKFN